jgi:bifunctional DNA-binding transcriptional regulator/antitoxin component of YhaV-PrlF toxin-antitoxin module
MLFIIKNTILNMKINEETKVRNQGKISLITTIPKTYVKALNIESGDTLEWILDTETETLELKIIK